MAIAVTARLLATLTRSPRWSFRSGRALEKLGRHDAALSAYGRAITAPSAPPEWRLSAARLLEERGRWTDAAVHYRAVLAALPERGTLRIPLATALERTGDRAAACHELHAFLAGGDDHSEADLYDVGALFERWNDVAGALAAYTRIDAARGGDRPTKLAVRLAKVNRRLGDLDRAEEIVAAGLAASPDHQGLLREHAELATARRDWDAAVTRWQQVVDGSPEPIPVAYLTRLVTAQRASGHVDEAVATIRRARSWYPDELQLAVEDARVCIAMYGRVAEDEKHGWKERLVALERLLSEREAEVLGSPPWGRALGNLHLVLRAWDAAVATWRTLEERYPDLRDEACIKQAKAHRSAGKEAFARAALPIDDPARLDRSRAEEHFVLARDALDRVSPHPSSAEHLDAERGRLAVQSGRWAASHAADVARLRLQVGQADAAGHLIDGALALRGFDQEQIAALRPIVARLGALAGTQPTTLEDVDASWDQPPVRRTVLVSGFLYSGSGAAYDYLRQYGSAAEPFGSHELWVLKKLNNFGLLLDPQHLDVDRFGDVAVASILTNIFGFGQMGYPISVYFEAEPGAMAELTAMVLPFVAELTRLADVARTGSGTVDAAGVELALRSFFTALVARFTPQDRTALLNNVVPAFQLVRYMDLFPEARAVVVVRDPRDQYVSQRLESPYSRDSSSFAAMMESRYRSFAELMTSPLRDRVVAVRFEDFVEREDVRRDIARWLELDGGDEDAGTSFDPARSRRNVGIHASYPRQDEVAEVAGRLLEPFSELTLGAAPVVTAARPPTR